MRRIGKGTVLLLVFLFFMAGLGVQRIYAAEPEITLRYAGNLPINHFITKSQEFFAKRVMERTNGKVKVEVFPAGQLFSDKDMLRALPSGAVDIGEVFCPQWTGIVPLWIYWDLPLLFRDREHWHRVADTEVGEMMKEAPLEKHAGFRVLYWMHAGGTGFATKQSIRSLEDFKGKRIRGVGEIVLEGIKAMGGSPVFMGGGEVYMALQRGTIDGANSLIASFASRKYYEVTKYLACDDWNFGMAVTLINEKKWESLPPDVQKEILGAAEEAKMWTRKASEDADTESLNLLKEKGMEFFDLRGEERKKWREACKPLQDYYIERAGEKAKTILEIGERVR